MKIPEGYKPKWYYGFAWRDYITNRAVIYPIPFNIIARVARRFWFWLAGYRKSNEDVVYQAGYESGLRTGRTRAEKELVDMWKTFLDNEKTN